MQERYDHREAGAPLPELSNDLYTCYAAFSAPAERWLTLSEREAAIIELEQVMGSAPATLRGAYSMQGFRADAEIMFWFIGESAEAIQDSIVQLRQTQFGRTLNPWWTSMGVHRDSEFNRSHVPSYALGLEPKTFVSVYPYVRSLEWYLLPAEERRDMLAEHGRMGRKFTGIQPNTVPSFGMGDYEWLLALETDDLTELNDMMRELRAASARKHTKEEVPFLVGRRLPIRELLTQLPVAIEKVAAPA